ncbi:fibronectin type III-like domain-contianing protein [Streptomyces sp. NPDC004980]
MFGVRAESWHPEEVAQGYCGRRGAPSTPATGRPTAGRWAAGSWLVSASVRQADRDVGGPGGRARLAPPVVSQLYLRANTSGVTRPAQQLGGFARVHLQPGEARRITFTVSASQLGHTNARGGFSVDPGRTDLFIGTSSDDHRLTGAFDVHGKTRPLMSRERSYFSDTRLDSPESSKA